MSSKRGLSRGKLARQTGINSETILYYEKSGLLHEPPRTAGGHRVYDSSHIQALEFVKRARGLGFAPKDVRIILGLNDQAIAPCAKVRDIATQHLEQVRSKIADLRQIEKLLGETIDRCSDDVDTDCAVLELLEGKSATH